MKGAFSGRASSKTLSRFQTSPPLHLFFAFFFSFSSSPSSFFLIYFTHSSLFLFFFFYLFFSFFLMSQYIKQPIFFPSFDLLLVIWQTSRVLFPKFFFLCRPFSPFCFFQRKYFLFPGGIQKRERFFFYFFLSLLTVLF